MHDRRTFLVAAAALAVASFLRPASNARSSLSDGTTEIEATAAGQGHPRTRHRQQPLATASDRADDRPDQRRRRATAEPVLASGMVGDGPAYIRRTR